MMKTLYNIQYEGEADLPHQTSKYWVSNLQIQDSPHPPGATNPETCLRRAAQSKQLAQPSLRKSDPPGCWKILLTKWKSGSRYEIRSQCIPGYYGGQGDEEENAYEFLGYNFLVSHAGDPSHGGLCEAETAGTL